MQIAVVLAGRVRTGALGVVCVAARDATVRCAREGGSVMMPRGPMLLRSLWRGGRVGDCDVIGSRGTVRSSEFSRGCCDKLLVVIRLGRMLPLGPRVGGGSVLPIMLAPAVPTETSEGVEPAVRRIAVALAGGVTRSRGGGDCCTGMSEDTISARVIL